MLNRECPICGEKIGSVLKNIKMALSEDVRIPREYDVVNCINCGFTYADVNATQEDYNFYYAMDNNYADSTEIKLVGKNTSVIHMLNYLKRHIDVNEKILDVGCGSGELLISLKNAGYTNLWGLDPTQGAIDILAAQQINGIKKNVFDEWKIEDKFDVIISTCVLEHIYDLRGFINKIIEHLKVGGQFYVVVPAVEGFEQYYQSLPNYFNQEHINYFSANSLKNLMLSNGFEELLSNSASFYMISNLVSNGDLMLQNMFMYTGREEKINKFDSVSSSSILNYFKHCDLDNKKSSLLESMQKIDDGCIIWGSGALAMSMMADKDFVEKVDFFVDNNKAKQGKDILGKKIFSPSILLDKEYEKKTIIVMCMQYSNEIVEQIKEMNLQNSVIVY